MTSLLFKFLQLPHSHHYPFIFLNKFTQRKALTFNIQCLYKRHQNITMQTHGKQRKYIIMFLLFSLFFVVVFFMNLFHMKRASVTLNVTLFLYVEITHESFI